MGAAWRAVARSVAAVAAWRGFKPAVFVACAVPLTLLARAFWLVLTGRDEGALGPDPTKELLHETGEVAITLLLATLTVTPLRRLTGANRLHGVRRMLGLWAFTYAAVHLSVYLALDQLCYSVLTCQFGAIWQDILKRRFIFAGQIGFVILLALAVTSTTGWMRRLRRNWTRLHRLVYVAAAAAIVHFFWIQKSDYSRPALWAAWLAVVLLIRLTWAVAGRRAGR